MKSETLREFYEASINSYVKEFCDRYELDYDEMVWLGDVGHITMIGDYYFNFRDIKDAIDLELPWEKVEEWYYDNLERKIATPLKIWMEG